MAGARSSTPTVARSSHDPARFFWFAFRDVLPFEDELGVILWGRSTRPAGEWKGLLPELALAPTCESTELCSHAQVCKSGRCLPCESDGECLPAEVCVLDHCILSEQASCRAARDCPAPLCLLDDYSAGARNNQAMHARCADLR